MPEIQGFCGLRFNPDKTGPLEGVVTPPYDVISPAQRAELAGKSPYNMVHVSLPEPLAGETPYDAAARILRQWRADGALVQDDAQSFYLLEQVFESGGRQRIRRGFFALARLPKPGEHSILGHEQTFARTVEDRMRLIEATKANLEPVFVLYADPGGKVGQCLSGAAAQRRPDMTVRTMDGVLQRVWRVAYDPRITELLSDSRLYIADGHHRFRTSCAYRDACREKGMGEGPHDFIMMGFVAIDDPGLVIEPTHRLLKPPGEFDAPAFLERLAPYFDYEPAGEDLPRTVDHESQCVLGLVTPGGRWLLRLHETKRVALLGTDRGPAWRDLDVAVLHRGIVERIMGWPADTPFVYERAPGKAVERVESGEFAAAFLLRSPRAEQIQACAEAGEPMPHKSTYFFPKLPSGTVIYSLD